MAVHPTCPFLLSASNNDNVIKLWDWDQRWVCTRKFLGHPSGVESFRFNPRDINMFASVGIDGSAKVCLFSFFS
jgi:WD40 repeat protein